VLSMPFPLRYRLIYDAALLSDVLNIFLRALFGNLKRRARLLLNLPSSLARRYLVSRYYRDE
jgi:hypothetical protein